MNANGIKVGGVLLCGGKSTRMGESKAHLPFDGKTMAQHVFATMTQVVHPIVVVAAKGQDLPVLPGAILVRDERPEQGPLEGIRVGLRALESHCEAGFVSSCDVPLLRPAFIGKLIDLLDDHDAAVPFEGKFAHPVTAVYRTSVIPTIEELVQEDLWRPRFLIDRVRSRKVDVATLREVDPELESLMNINRPEDYEKVRAVARLSKSGPNTD